MEPIFMGNKEPGCLPLLVSSAFYWTPSQEMPCASTIETQSLVLLTLFIPQGSDESAPVAWTLPGEPEVSVQDQKAGKTAAAAGQKHHSTWVPPKLPYLTLRRLVAPLLLPVVDLDGQYHQGLKT